VQYENTILQTRDMHISQSYDRNQEHYYALFNVRRSKRHLEQTAEFLLLRIYFRRYAPKHPRRFFGAVPVVRYFAAISSASTISSPRKAMAVALFSSACLWMIAFLFFIFSAYSAFFFSSSS
jgi:hypothetical protein